MAARGQSPRATHPSHSHVSHVFYVV